MTRRPERRTGINQDLIKLAAIVLMALNHIGLIFLVPGSGLYTVFVNAGYFTAITMCYFLVEGYHYTRDRGKYGLRLLLFALVSELPYRLALDTKTHSMIFTLLVCFGILWVQEEIRDTLLRAIATVCLILLTGSSDWGVLAPIFTLLFWWSYPSRRQGALAYGLGILFYGADEFLFYAEYSASLWQALLRTGLSCLGPLCSGLVILYLYNGKRARRGKLVFQWFFYLFYPAHLLVLWAVSEGFLGLRP